MNNKTTNYIAAAIFAYIFVMSIVLGTYFLIISDNIWASIWAINHIIIPFIVMFILMLRAKEYLQLKQKIQEDEQ